MLGTVDEEYIYSIVPDEPTTPLLLPFLKVTIMELDMENASRNKDVTLIDSQTNQALYRITNFQNSMFQSPKVNVISRLSRGSREERLAKLEKGWFNDHITINAGGVRLKAKKFFDVAVFGGYVVGSLVGLSADIQSYIILTSATDTIRSPDQMGVPVTGGSSRTMA